MVHTGGHGVPVAAGAVDAEVPALILVVLVAVPQVHLATVVFPVRSVQALGAVSGLETPRGLRVSPLLVLVLGGTVPHVHLPPGLVPLGGIEALAAVPSLDLARGRMVHPSLVL